MWSRTQEADKVELDLAKGGNHHAQDDDTDVSEDLHVRRGDAKGPGREQCDDSIGGLFANGQLTLVVVACKGSCLDLP